MAAVEHIRRMHGGTQPQLMRCSDGGYYVVKFSNNPQHPRVLANEWVAAVLAREMGLPAPEPAAVEVPDALIEQSAEMVMHLPRGQTKCRPGRHFGSRYPGNPARAAVYDFLPDEHLLQVENLADFLGMLVFDKWTCNTDKRQVVFHRSERQPRFRALMIDHGCCFGGGEWCFPDAPLRGLYARTLVYGSATGSRSLAPWLDRLQSGAMEQALDGLLGGTPPEWHNFDCDGFCRLLDRLRRRRRDVPDLIRAAGESYRRPFPRWR